MYTEIRIHFEGTDLLRSGFGVFFSELRLRATKRGCGFRLVAGGSGDGACRDFALALQEHPDALNILLRDSEGPVVVNASALLCQRQNWAPENADSIFWMVQMMEAWFHADRSALQKFYGANFRENALAKNPKVERIPKKDLADGLKAATKDTQKGDYYEHKASHGATLLTKENCNGSR